MTLATSWSDPIAVATFALAIATALMAWQTWRVADKSAQEVVEATAQAKLSAEALALSVQPLLGEALPSQRGETTTGAFPAPGRDGYTLHLDQFYLRENHVSIPFSNIGPGVAVIKRAWSEPPFSGTEVTAHLVPAGGTMRVNLSAAEVEEIYAQLEILGMSFTVAIEYADARGDQTYVTRALVASYATSEPAIRGLSVTRGNEEEPFVVGGRMDP